MPLPFVLMGLAASAAVVGAKKAYDSRKTKKEANEIYALAGKTHAEANALLEANRQSTLSAMDAFGVLQLKVFSEELDAFAAQFSQLKNVAMKDGPQQQSLPTFERHQLEEIRATALKAREVAAGGMTAVGSGALAGVACYGGATMLATASTGTAMSTLTGAAATNATLAWFGGGSLAAGGAGMAGGMMVLGGLVSGPMLGVGGLVLYAKAKSHLADARKSLADCEIEAEKKKNAVAALKDIQEMVVLFHDATQKAASRLSVLNARLAQTFITNGTDYAEYNDDEKHTAFLSATAAKGLSILIDTPLLTPEGNLASRVPLALQSAENLLVDAEG